MPKVVQTAGRDALGTFAPQFAALNDDVLFGEVWSSDELTLKMRSILTVTTLVAKGMADGSFEHHVANAKKNGVTAREMAAILTHVAFYAGWPNAWAAFRVALKVYAADPLDFENPEGHGGLFGLGAPNDAYAQYFTGQSYLNPLTDSEKTQFIANVTFEPGCRNNWHIHHAAEGGGQILLVTDGEGWDQEWGACPQDRRRRRGVYPSQREALARCHRRPLDEPRGLRGPGHRLRKRVVRARHRRGVRRPFVTARTSGRPSVSQIAGTLNGSAPTPSK